MRLRQCRQETVRAILKWSMADLLMMLFSALHRGQVYRITYPVRVPLTSGYVFRVFIMRGFLWCSSVPQALLPEKPTGQSKIVLQGFPNAGNTGSLRYKFAEWQNR